MEIHAENASEALDQTCVICAKVLRSTSMRQHMLTHSDDPKSRYKFSCKFCDAVYMKKQNLDIHIETKHGDGLGAMRNCEICGKSILKGNYRKHLARHDG